MIGSTDAHGALTLTREENWFGKAHIVEPSSERYKDVRIKSPVDPSLLITALKLNASGLAAVWAREGARPRPSRIAKGGASDRCSSPGVRRRRMRVLLVATGARRLAQSDQQRASVTRMREITDTCALLPSTGD